MSTKSDILLSLIRSIEQFGAQLEDIIASNREQLAKAREHIGDSRTQVEPPETQRTRKNGSFLP